MASEKRQKDDDEDIVAARHIGKITTIETNRRAEATKRSGAVYSAPDMLLGAATSSTLEE
jgi:hypothetical protein